MKAFEQILEKERKNRIEFFKDRFSIRLKTIRTEKNLSQKEVAQKLCVAVSTYANWEQGRTEPSIYDIYNLLWVYEIEANELFNPIEEIITNKIY